MPSWRPAGPTVSPTHPLSARSSVGVLRARTMRARRKSPHGRDNEDAPCPRWRIRPLRSASRTENWYPARDGSLPPVGGSSIPPGHSEISGAEGSLRVLLAHLSTPPRAQGRRDASSSKPPLERAGERAASPTVASTHTRRHSVCDQSFRPSAATDSCWMEPGRMLRRHTMHARSTVARLAWTSLGASGSVWCWSRARTL